MVVESWLCSVVRVAWVCVTRLLPESKHVPCLNSKSGYKNLPHIYLMRPLPSDIFLGLLPEPANSSAAFFAFLFSFAASRCASFVTLSSAANSKCFAWRSWNNGRGWVKFRGRAFWRRWALWRACMLMTKRSTGLCLMYDSIIPESWRSCFWRC